MESRSCWIRRSFSNSTAKGNIYGIGEWWTNLFFFTTCSLIYFSWSTSSHGWALYQRHLTKVFPLCMTRYIVVDHRNNFGNQTLWHWNWVSKVLIDGWSVLICQLGNTCITYLPTCGVFEWEIRHMEFWPDQSCTCIMSTWWCWSWHVVVTGVAWGWGLGFQMKRQKPTAWFLLGLLYLSTAWNLEFEDVFYIYNKGTKKHNLYNRHQFCTSVHLRLFIAGKYPPWNYSNSKFAPENGWSWNTI